MKKVAIVTGGASGIGRGLCEGIARRGDIVIVTDINVEGAEAVAQRIIQQGGRAEAMNMDVSNLEAVHETVAHVIECYGRLDYYYHNAGIGIACEVRDMTYARWQRIVDINLWGVIYGTHEAYAVMLERGFGHIINVASMAGIVTNVTSPAYTATKFAVVGLTQALRIEAQALGIRVSLVCPASIETGIRDSIVFVNTDRKAYLKTIAESRKTQWFAKAWDAATAAEYILDEVAKNTALILLPPSAKKIRWIARLFPSYIDKVQHKLLARFRQFRLEDQAQA
jgi:NAD(P)-dependent dehydrogenase (short-subunit alcohol dehydrogenase family)